MNNKLFVFRKMSPDDPVNHLIAVLHRDKKGEITIESRLDGRDLSQSYSIPILSSPETETVNEYKTRVRKWLGEFLPPLDNKALLDVLMKKAGITEYDEWEWLKRFRPDSRSMISFSDTFPENYMRHDLKLSFIDGEDSQTFYTNQNYDNDDPDIDLVDDFRIDDDDFDEDEEEEDDTAWNEWLEQDEEDDRMTSDSFDVYDENTAFPFPLFENDAKPEKPVTDLKTFSELQDMGFVTNKTTIRKTFEALAEVPLSVYMSDMKDPMKYIENLSEMSGIPAKKIKDFTIYDVLKEFSSMIKTNDEPAEYSGNIETVYRIMSMPIGNAIIKKTNRR